MKFRSRIFWALFGFGLLGSIGTAGVLIFKQTKTLKEQFLAQNLEKHRVIGDVLLQIERSSEQLNKAALNHYIDIVANKSLPSNDQLKDLTSKLGVTHLYATNDKGDFIRDTDVAEGQKPEDKKANIFRFCQDYKNIISSNNKFELTPILPSFPYRGPYKFAMGSSKDKKYILETGIHVVEISNTLFSAMSSDVDLLNISLHSPSGFELASETRNQFKPTQVISKIIQSELTTLNSDSSPHVTFENNFMMIIKPIQSSQKTCCECQTKNISSKGTDSYFYVLSTITSANRLNAQINLFLYLTIGISFGFIVLSYFLANWITNRLLARLNRLSKMAEQLTLDPSQSLIFDETGNDEVSTISKAFNGALKTLFNSQQKLIDSEKQRALVATARQVAHDIRSPLAAMDMIMKGLGELPEDKRVIIRGAIGRIRDIANNLVAKSQMPGHDTDGLGTQIELLASLIDSLATEKRLQFRSRMGVEIDLELGAGSYAAFSKVNSAELKRVLSNLINNAVEALNNERGQVHLMLQSSGDEVAITIVDNGKGIDPNILPKLGQEGFSVGKENSPDSGSGLGLAHARKTLEQWGGVFVIQSKLGQGTSLTITLPKSPTPEWFVEKLSLKPTAHVVILDDDTSVHRIWDERFDSMNLKTKYPQIRVHHFSRPDELRGFKVQHQNVSCLYLCDYELLGFKDTGLSLIEELGLQRQAVLVTSRFEESDVRLRAEKSGVKLIPKTLVNLVPIEMSALSLDTDLVLLDDDALVRQTWILSAREKNMNLKVYGDTIEFMNDIRFDKISKHTPLYIDVSLEDNMDGRDVAKECFKLGYTQIWLATGHDPQNLDRTGLDFLKGVSGKEFPIV